MNKNMLIGLAFTLTLGVSLGTAFSAVANTKQKECCEHPLTARADNVNYRPLNSGDIIIPIYSQSVVGKNKVQFEIDSKDINILSFLMASTATFHTSETKADDRLCPFIDIDKKFITRKNLEHGRTRITMSLSPEIVDVVKRCQCVITTRPDP